MEDKIITNNPLVRERCGNQHCVEYLEISFLEILITVRDLIHKGHYMMTHPLSGSIKPNETPYKSILVSSGRAMLDVDSLRIIEESIAVCRKFPVRQPELPANILADFQEMDYVLIAGALRD